MRQTPLHESHLLEAVRRKILSSDQMEQVLALARATPADGTVADVRWATAVQGLLAAAAVLGAGIGIAVDIDAHGATLVTAAYSAAGLAASLGLAWYLRRFSWGRVPGSILTAGAAVWSVGVAIGLLSLVLPLNRYASDGSAVFADYGYLQSRMWLADAIACGASGLFALALWRWRRNGPALGLAAAHGLMGALLLLSSHTLYAYLPSSMWALAVIALGGAIVAVAAALDRRAHGPVDGAFWLYPVAMLPMGFAGMMRIDRAPAEVFVWLPLALAVGALAYRNGRRFPLLFSAMAAVIFPAFALSQAHAADAAIIGALVASAVAIAVAVPVLRSRDLGTAITAVARPSPWG